MKPTKELKTLETTTEASPLAPLLNKPRKQAQDVPSAGRRSFLSRALTALPVAALAVSAVGASSRTTEKKFPAVGDRYLFTARTPIKPYTVASVQLRTHKTDGGPDFLIMMLPEGDSTYGIAVIDKPPGLSRGDALPGAVFVFSMGGFNEWFRGPQ